MFRYFMYFCKLGGSKIGTRIALKCWNIYTYLNYLIISFFSVELYLMFFLIILAITKINENFIYAYIKFSVNSLSDAGNIPYSQNL